MEGLATVHSLADRIGRELLTFGRVRSLDERLTAIRAVTPADVQRVIRKYLVPDHRSVVHVVPPPAGHGDDPAAPAASTEEEVSQ